MEQELEIRPAQRTKAKIRINMSSPAGWGKTYSSLLIAYGLVGDWTKIAVIDTENKSADLYAHLGQYQVVPIENDYSPETYVKAIDLCEKAGIEAIIVDSITHEWKWCLTAVDKLERGNSGWAKITPRHDNFVHRLLNSPCHIITCVRQGSEYAAVTKESGKTYLEKVGTKDDFRPNWDFEVTINFNFNAKHMAVATKDRTGIYMKSDKEDSAPFKPTIKTGIEIKGWCEEGIDVEQQAISSVAKCDSVDELAMLYESLRASTQKNETFLHVLKMRVIILTQVLQSANQILSDWLALPFFWEDAEVKRAYRNRAIEMIASFDSITELQTFYTTLCGTKDSAPPMPYLRDDAEFKKQVVMAKEVIESAEEKDIFATKSTTVVGVVGDGTKQNPIKKKYAKRVAKK
jgi:hypothetical protein